MTPETIVATIGAVAEAVAEGFKFAQTPQGQELVKRSIEDRAAFEKNVSAAGQWLQKLFTGKL
jgi:hypothetical protein